MSSLTRDFVRYARTMPHLPTILTLVLALAATAISAWVMLNAGRQATLAQVRNETLNLRDVIVDVVTAYEQVLKAGAGFVNAAGKPNQESWRTFVSSLRLDRNFPGIQGLGYAEVIPRDGIAAHVAEQRRAGRRGYTWSPPGERDLYTAIVFLEPDNWRNQRAIGFDMYSETFRRRAMMQARDTGEAALSKPVTLLQETSQDVQRGVLFYHPVYADGVIPATVEERRAKLVAYVYGAFRLGDLVNRSLGKRAPEALSKFRLQILDDHKLDDDRILFDSLADIASSGTGNATHAPAYVHREPLQVAGQSWEVEVSSRTAFEDTIDRTKFWIVLVSGLSISLLIAAISAALSFEHERSLASERMLAAEVEERRLAQERAQLANNELIHRVKNTLAVVSAIASQTARHSSSLPEFVKAFRDRLAALGKVQDLLRPDPAYAPQLGPFVRSILEPFTSSNTGPAKSRLAIEGPAIAIPRSEAVLFSLLVNELATNAAKYGAWSVPDGTVDIAWHLDQDDDGAQRVRWSWRERGGPKVAAPTRVGFGSYVMQSIERGMRGKIEMAFDPEGLRCLFSFPLPQSDARESDASYPV